MVEEKELIVKKTALTGTGQARLNPETLKELEVDKSDKIEVSKGGNSVKLQTHPSAGIDKMEIRLNGEDIEEISASAGDKVLVKKAT